MKKEKPHKNSKIMYDQKEAQDWADAMQAYADAVRTWAYGAADDGKIGTNPPTPPPPPPGTL